MEKSNDVNEINCIRFLEAISFGKPIVGVPFFFDQHMNMKIAHQKGHGINIPVETLTADNFKAAIVEVMDNPRFAIQLHFYLQYFDAYDIYDMIL